MIEIRIHGRGGQGAVTTGQLMAIAAFYDGKESQTFPNFGVERSGAPVEAFARIDKEKINIRSQVYSPDVVIVLDSSLLDAVDVTKGLKDNGTLIINTSKGHNELGIKGDFKVHVVDATSIAMEIFKKPIVNTVVLGSFAAVTKVISLKSLQKAIDDKFLHSKGKKIADINKEAIKKAYDETDKR
jgi:pyruvate ferredoxin oxidoreductase gamma subunit